MNFAEYLIAGLSPFSTVALILAFYMEAISQGSAPHMTFDLAIITLLMIASTAVQFFTFHLATEHDGGWASLVTLAHIAGIIASMLLLILSVLMLFGGLVMLPPFACICAILSRLSGTAM